MTRTQRIQLRQAELRQRLGGLLDVAPDQRAETHEADVAAVTNELRQLEGELQAAILADGPEPETRADTPEGRELRAMIDGANVGAIFAAAVEHRQTDGRERELQEHFSIPANAVPLELLQVREVTPGPANVGAEERPVVQPVFSLGDAAYLGVSMPTVPAGEAVFPVLTSRPAVGGPHTDSTAVAETTGAFEAEALSPGRLQASFFYKRTDAARFAGMGAALRMALSDGLSEALDAQTVAQIIADVDHADAGGADTFMSYRKRFVYDLVDGRYATSERDLRLLVGNDTLADAAILYRGNTADDSVIDSIRRVAGGLRVSPHVPATVGDKQDVVVRRGMREDAVAPLWQGVQLIPDEITKAGTGEIVITAVLLAAFKVIREDGFAIVQAQHA